MSYKTYKEYKEAKISWIDKIPSTWNMIKAKHCFELSGGYAFKSDEFIEEGIPLVRIGDISNGTIDFDNCKRLPLEYAVLMKEFLVKPGDILIALTGATIGKIGQVPKNNEKILLNQRVGKLSSDKSNYYKYILSSDLIKKQIMLIADGSAQENISNEDIGNFEIFDVDDNTKLQIANYLDKKTSKIDTTIAKNKELISLLEEKRTALINQVVTKGLNPEVPMKDSGIEWIGEIPEHWKTNKIKNMSYVKGRIGWHGLTSEEYSDEGAYLVTGTDFEEGTVDWNHCNHISYERYKQDPNIHLKEGDLLITKDGTIGKLALIKNIPDKATLNSGIFLVRPLKDNYTNEYLYWVLSSDIFTRFFDYIKTGATIAHLYQETFERFFFPYMDINEQNKIVDFLNINISKINFTIKKVEENIGLLEEYKTSLIHHVVTGKIDVRGEEI